MSADGANTAGAGGEKPFVLATNDDGLDSLFLRELIAALAPRFRVLAAAPAREQSWVGRAFSRLRDVSVRPRDGADCGGAWRAWAVDGTPSDCVNIALGGLLPESGLPPPAAVVSGINIGYNVTMPLCLSSGTLAGAIEGAAWGLPALAFSLELPDPEYIRAQRNHGAIEGLGLRSLRNAAGIAAALTAEAVATAAAPATPPPAGLLVRNVNFPRMTLPDTPVEQTAPEFVRLGRLYRRADASTFRFKWEKREPEAPAAHTDLACLRRGHISVSTLDFSRW
ncbi:MAG: 5'/3'-nucleotidase SurE [Puniceicoccales bacterium]|jgi:5'-nucleotidase|nr:5'/3'-nucleotidase SurE [Puniceicoccales bacterium]